MKKLFAIIPVLYLSVFLVAASKHVPLEHTRNETKPKFGGTFGVDISQPVSVESFNCMKDNGIQFVIVRAYQSIGQPDPNAPQTIANARAAGIPYVDVYMFPCPTCSTSAGEQVREMVDKLSGLKYGQIWLDIEGAQYWKGSESENQAFFKGLLVEASLHKTTGVYASASQWDQIMGAGYTGGAAHQLWWPRYDKNPSFSDFTPFGGWSSPAIKQYDGTSYLCNAGVDKDWY